MQQAAKSSKAAGGAADDPFAVIDPSLDALVSKFSGKWRGINMDDEDKFLSTDDWFNRSEERGGSRIAPKDWGFEGSRAPLIHTVRVFAHLHSELSQMCLT